jgi:hypothetical protein
LQRDAIAATRSVFDANDASRSFRLRRSRRGFVERKSDPNARFDLAIFQALNEKAAAGNVHGERGFQAHTEWAAPTDACRKLQACSRIFSKFEGNRYPGHRGLS